MALVTALHQFNYLPSALQSYSLPCSIYLFVCLFACSWLKHNMVQTCKRYLNTAWCLAWTTIVEIQKCPTRKMTGYCWISLLLSIVNFPELCHTSSVWSQRDIVSRLASVKVKVMRLANRGQTLLLLFSGKWWLLVGRNASKNTGIHTQISVGKKQKLKRFGFVLQLAFFLLASYS